MSTKPFFNLAGRLTLTKRGEAPFLSVAPFSIENPGVYTIEGPNGSGKSMLIGFLTGTLPGSIMGEKTTSFEINGAVVSIRNYRDAIKAGITTVFQRDDTITSMSTLDNIVLRHGKSTIRYFISYVYTVVIWQSASFVTDLLQSISPTLPSKIKSLVKRFEPKEIDWLDRKTLKDRALSIIHEYGMDPSILDKPTSQLSAGQKAAAKLICAQLYNATKILILDEAFSNVESNVWPQYVDRLKEWSLKEGKIIIAVTHSAEELRRWDADARYEIRDKELRKVEAMSGLRRRICLSKRISTPIYRVDEYNLNFILAELLDRFGPEEVIHLIDMNRQEDAVFKRFRSLRFPATSTKVVTFDFSKLGIEQLVVRLGEAAQKRGSLLFIFGDSYSRSIGSFASLLSHQLGLSGVVVVPIDFFDGINATLMPVVSTMRTLNPKKGTERLFKLTALFEPDAFVIFKNLAVGSGVRELKLALVPCVRLGLLFDEALYHEALQAFRLSQLSIERVSEVHAAAVRVFNEIVEIGLKEPGISRLLNFGNFHAAAVSEITARRIVDGEALLLGMFLEDLCANPDRETQRSRSPLRDFIELVDARMPEEMTEGIVNLQEFYKSILARDSLYKYEGVFVHDVGCFSVERFRARLIASRSAINIDLPTWANSQASAAVKEYGFHEIRLAIFKAMPSQTSDLWR